ncbi:hypothetical protein NO2_1159 [Candidatus Termititenax persephonae]|uniref:Uncharacterized protein n=1 Tax=Candidatus Termititenax persephonae TaxID=2218525 RepID=A0A388THL3_9BACT|nr:hypothetical protein NO2_1159 [Candidatus Termititenax persephonae]
MAEEQVYNSENSGGSGADEFVEIGQSVERIHKPPFAEDAVSLSGMVSSVLKPQDDKEREKIEREYKKRQEKLEKQERRKNMSQPFKPEKIFLPLLILAVAALGYGGYVSIPKIGEWFTAWRQTQAVRRFEIWDVRELVFADTFRLKLKTAPRADKTTLIISSEKRTESIAGKIVADDEKSLTWEFMVSRLRPGSYRYKAFVKNTKNNQWKEIRGVFTVK